MQSVTLRAWMAAGMAVVPLVLPLRVSTTDTPRGTASGTPLPHALDRYARTVARLTPGDIKSLVNGAPVAKLLDVGTVHEIAVFGAVWIDASPQRYVDAVNDIEQLERGGGFLITKRISEPPRLEDFARLELTADDIGGMRACRVGRCEIKLNESEIEALRREVDWSRPSAAADVNVFLRRTRVEYVAAYLEGGNARLSVYRDKERPVSVTAQFESMMGRLPPLVEDLPDLRRYLLEFPNVRLPGATSFLYWQAVDFGLQPTIRINHVVIWPFNDVVVVAIKLLYANHYFWTALDVRTLVPDPARGPGFWLVTDARSRSDGMTGFTGLFVRSRVRRGAQEGTLAALRATKRRLEIP